MRIPNSFIFFGAILFSPLLFAQKCHFLPPENWEYASLSHSKYVKAAFVGPTKGWFRPSLTFSFEEIDLSPSEYLKAVKKLYQEKETQSLKDLGKIETKSGSAFLLELSPKDNEGDLSTLQMIFPSDQKAFILTGSLPKKEFTHYSLILFKTFQSFSLINDYYDLIPDLSRKKALKELLDSFSQLKKLSESKKKKELLSLTKTLQKEFPELGSYTSLEMIKESL